MAKKIVEVQVVEVSPVETTVEVSPVEVQVVEVSPVEVPVVEVQVAETQKPKVGQRARQLILENILDNKAILAVLKKEYPEGKTSMACVAWYKSDVKKTKVDEDKPFKDWLKANEAKLRDEFEASLEASLEPVIA